MSCEALDICGGLWGAAPVPMPCHRAPPSVVTVHSQSGAGYPGGWPGLGAAQSSVVNVFSFAGCGVSSNFLNLVAESQKRPQYVNEQMWLCSRSFIYKELGAGVAQRPWLAGSAADSRAGGGRLRPPPSPRAAWGRGGACSSPARGAHSVD